MEMEYDQYRRMQGPVPEWEESQMRAEEELRGDIIRFIETEQRTHQRRMRPGREEDTEWEQKIQELFMRTNDMGVRADVVADIHNLYVKRRRYDLRRGFRMEATEPRKLVLRMFTYLANHAKEYMDAKAYNNKHIPFPICGLEYHGERMVAERNAQASALLRAICHPAGAQAIAAYCASVPVQVHMQHKITIPGNPHPMYRLRFIVHSPADNTLVKQCMEGSLNAIAEDGTIKHKPYFMKSVFVHSDGTCEVYSGPTPESNHPIISAVIKRRTTPWSSLHAPPFFHAIHHLNIRALIEGHLDYIHRTYFASTLFFPAEVESYFYSLTSTVPTIRDADIRHASDPTPLHPPGSPIADVRVPA